MVYTGRGDKGYTTILDVCLQKNSECIHFIGSVDEALAFVGLAIEEGTEDVRKRMVKVYTLLSKIAGALYTGWCPDDETIKTLEKEIDEAPKPKSFIPNFSVRKGVATIAIARTVIRRAERWFWACHKSLDIGCENIGKLLNRLSDYVFIVQYMAFLESSKPKPKSRVDA